MARTEIEKLTEEIRRQLTAALGDAGQMQSKAMEARIVGIKHDAQAKQLPYYVLDQISSAKVTISECCGKRNSRNPDKLRFAREDISKVCYLAH